MSPAQTQAQLERAHELLSIGRGRETAAIAESVLAAEPEHVWALTLLTLALMETADHARALAVVNRLVAAAPDRAHSHRLASMVLQELGQRTEALRAAETAVQLDPLDADGFVRLALAAHGVRGHRAQARAAADEAVRLDPLDPDSHFAVGFTARGRRAKRAAYRQVLAIDPTHRAAANNELVARGRTWALRPLVTGYLAVLSGDPSFAVARANLVALLTRFVRRYYVAGIALFVLTVVLYAVSGESTDFSWWRLGLGAVVAVLLVAYAVRMRAVVPPGARVFLARAWRSDALLIVTTLHALAVLLLTLLPLAVSPLTPIVFLALPLMIWGNLGLAVWGWSTRAARRRRRP